MSKKSETKFTFANSNAVNILQTKDAGVKPMPPDRWEATFQVRAAKITFRSYHKSRDAAMIEMVTLCSQYIQDHFGGAPKLVSMKRLGKN